MIVNVNGEELEKFKEGSIRELTVRPTEALLNLKQGDLICELLEQPELVTTRLENAQLKEQVKTLQRQLNARRR